MKNSIQKKKIKYPCRWAYQIIAEEVCPIASILKSIILDQEYQLKETNKSQQGKYKSYLLDMVVFHQKHRDQIYQAIQQIDLVKMVL